MRITLLSGLIVVLLLAVSILRAQEHGPTVAAARIAVTAPPAPDDYATRPYAPPADCGSVVKNAVLLGAGFSLATMMIELMYTIVREPFVQNGHDWPAADPTLIAWAGGAGVVVGLVGTHLCRRRRR